jgi:23S rRNA (guanine745-N1)-methyltransferase
MHVTPLMALACPLDGLALQKRGAQLCCAAGHSYDRAREGYWNLLAVQHKASLDPGDSRVMVAARRRFLDVGYYAPIGRALTETVLGHVRDAPTDRPFRVADAGCGEGHYIDALALAVLSGHDQIGQATAGDAGKNADAGTLALAGFDISKWAVKAAARRNIYITWLVANNRHPPFPAHSIDLLLCVFGFPVWEGFAPVQPAGGHVVLVDPGPDHLIELREIIYPTVTRSEPTGLQAAEAAGYALVDTRAVRFAINLEGPAVIADLLAMTPHAHRLSTEGRTRLAAVQSLTVTVEVVVRTLRLV